MSLPKAITFDCYGTLVDWESEVQAFFSNILQKHGVQLNRDQIVSLQRRWEEIQFDYIQEAYRPYHQVLRDTLSMTFQEGGFPFTEEDGEEFAASMGSWKTFPDTIDALHELKKYTKIALITNTDDAIIAETVANMGVQFDAIITAEQAGAYKPSHTGFQLALEKLGLDKSEILHAGFGFKYDVVPASQLGIKTCWINRSGEVRAG